MSWSPSDAIENHLLFSSKGTFTSYLAFSSIKNCIFSRGSRANSYLEKDVVILIAFSIVRICYPFFSLQAEWSMKSLSTLAFELFSIVYSKDFFYSDSF